MAGTASTEAGKEGGAKLHVAGLLTLTGSGKSGSTEGSNSRIKFVVPLGLPEEPTTAAALSEYREKQKQAREEADARIRARPANCLGY